MSSLPEDDWDKAPAVEKQTVSYVVRGLRTFWRLIASEHNQIFRAVLVLLVIEMLVLSFPLFFRELVDRMPSIITQGITGSAVGLVAGMFLARVLVHVLRRFVQEPIFLRAIIRLENLLPKLAHEKLLALHLAFHEQASVGRMIAKVSKGVDKIINILDNLFWTLAPAIFSLVMSVVVLFVLDWRLALLFVLPIIPAVWINLSCYKKFFPQWELYEKEKERAVGLFCRSAIAVQMIQLFVREKAEARAHRQVREGMCELDIRICLRIQWYHFIMELMLGLTFITTVVVGLYFVYRGWSTVGTVSYLFVTGNATSQSVWSVVQVYTRMLRDLVAAERLQALLDEPEEVRNDAKGVLPSEPEADIHFRNVSFMYPNKEGAVIEKLSLSVKRGEMLALVGPSGSGKSTLARLLTRTYDSTGGTVLLGKEDFRRLDRDVLRRLFAVVSQDVVIVDGTIQDNVVFAHPEASFDMIAQALEAACLGECLADIGRFKDGLATEVGERGVKLSGGERQRVGIARAYIAILAGARILVLDEATASLDSESERVVQGFVERLRRERNVTIVAIAHRLSTIAQADRICVLERGMVTETGTHEQLLKHNGLYARLVALQQLGELRE